jgi:hypothetical protein
LLLAGYTSLPNLLFRHYTALAMTEAELVLVLQLWTYWWDERAPFPSVGTLAAHMGKSPRQIQQLVERLRGKGLLIVMPRFGTNGTQLTNTYDLTPLVDRLGTQAAVPALPDGEVRTPVGLGMQNSPEEGVQEASPKQDPDYNAQKRCSDPMPPTPATARRSAMAVVTEDMPTLSPPLWEAVLRVSNECGDDLPAASLNRAARLLMERGVSEARFLAALEHARTQTQAHRARLRAQLPDGRRRGMPYCFAVLESVLRPRRDKESRVSPRVRRPIREALPVPAAEPAASETPWAKVLRELQETLAPSVYARLCSLRAYSDADGHLVIEVASEYERTWLARMVGRRIVEALQRQVQGEPRIRISAAAA